jgi:hypothetical protein
VEALWQQWASDYPEDGMRTSLTIVVVLLSIMSRIAIGQDALRVEHQSRTKSGSAGPS